MSRCLVSSLFPCLPYVLPFLSSTLFTFLCKNEPKQANLFLNIQEIPQKGPSLRKRGSLCPHMCAPAELTWC